MLSIMFKVLIHIKFSRNSRIIAIVVKKKSNPKLFRQTCGTPTPRYQVLVYTGLSLSEYCIENMSKFVKQRVAKMQLFHISFII